MTFLANIGYRFELPGSVSPDGVVILSSAMPIHQLERRKLGSGYPKMANRLFDPQLYLAGLDASESADHCVKLASYPWFGIKGVDSYSSRLQRQKDWKDEIKRNIVTLWPQRPPEDPGVIRSSVRECVDFQLKLGCGEIILPSPLTSDPGTDYGLELEWLDAGLEYIKSLRDTIPVFATVAVADTCLRYIDSNANGLLAQILDAVSAREVDGVYILLEQGSEALDTRNCGNVRSLGSILHLVHVFSNDCKLRVIVNFMGAFGLVCEAAGAEAWAASWYKSLYRFRLADKLAGGRSYPQFWSSPAALDIHLENDMNRISRMPELMSNVSDLTEASQGLMDALARGARVSDVPAWRYSQSNVSAAQEHFWLSAIKNEKENRRFLGGTRLDWVEKWLSGALERAQSVQKAIGGEGKTKTAHVRAWYEAFLAYRRDHNV